MLQLKNYATGTWMKILTNKSIYSDVLSTKAMKRANLAVTELFLDIWIDYNVQCFISAFTSFCFLMMTENSV